MVCAFNSVAQGSLFYTSQGTTPFPENSDNSIELEKVVRQSTYSDRFYAFVQFQDLPDSEIHHAIQQLDISLLEYIPKKVYLASFPVDLDLNQLRNIGVTGMMSVDRVFKMDQRLLDHDIPNWARERDDIKISLKYYDDIPLNEVLSELESLLIPVVSMQEHAQLLHLTIKESKIDGLADKHFVQFLGLTSEPGMPESEIGRVLHSANLIDGDYAGARNYDGTGITMAVNDDGYVGPMSQETS
jgi:hypothetical protein